MTHCGCGEINSVSNSKDDFADKLTSFYSEVILFNFLKSIGFSLKHPKAGYDFHFDFEGNKYNIESSSIFNAKKRAFQLSKRIYYAVPFCEVYTENDGYQIVWARWANSIERKLKQLGKTKDYKNSFNFIFIDMQKLFFNHGGWGGDKTEKSMMCFLYNIDWKKMKESDYKHSSVLSREETKISIKDKTFYTHDFSFFSDNEHMRNINGVFYTFTTFNGLFEYMDCEIFLFLNPNAHTQVPESFLEKIQKENEIAKLIINNDWKRFFNND